jgi:transposase
MPNTVKICKKAKQNAQQAEARDWTPGREGYRFLETEDEYCDLKQRLIVVDSEALAKTQRKSFDKKVQRLFESAESEAKKLSRLEFSCLQDAEKAVQLKNKKMTYHQIEIVKHSTKKHFQGPGRPSKDDKPELTYQLELKVVTVLEAVNCTRKELGMFVLVTNNLDRENFTASEALEGYKGLGANERFFRFLKDPHFFADSFYLKKTGRLSALLCIMTLALLIYHLCELKVRSTVKEHRITVLNLDKRKLKNPTAKLIFQHFAGVSVIQIFSATGELVQSFFEMLTEFQKKLLEALGPPYLAMYQTE